MKYVLALLIVTLVSTVALGKPPIWPEPAPTSPVKAPSSPVEPIWPESGNLPYQVVETPVFGLLGANSTCVGGNCQPQASQRRGLFGFRR